jgi:hypothetical protein
MPSPQNQQETPRKRKLGALCWTPRLRIDSLFHQVLQLERDGLQRDSGMLEQRMPTNFVCEFFMRVDPYKDSELLEAMSTFGNHWGIFVKISFCI